MALRIVTFTLLFLASSIFTFAQSDSDDPRTPACIRKPWELTGPHAYRVGHGVTPPDLVMKVSPAYPDWAKAEGKEGNVVLNLVVDQDGFPRNLCILRSMRDDFDQNAAKAVAQWRFMPALKEGKPVSVLINVEVNFNLFPRRGPTAPGQLAVSH